MKKKTSSIKYKVPAVEKAFAIVELFAAENRGYTLSEVSRLLKLPISTTSSLLYTMQHCGYLTKAEGGDFFLTTRLLTESSKALRQVVIHEVAEPELKKLANTTGLTALIAIREGDQMVYVGKVEGASQIKLSSYVGKRSDLHLTAMGKVLFAFLSENNVEDIVATAGLVAKTPRTITTITALKKELNLIRAQGYAVDDEESGVGIRAIASPIFEHNGAIVASVGVSGATFEFDDDLQKVIKIVKDRAMAISTSLGYQETLISTRTRRAS